MELIRGQIIFLAGSVVSGFVVMECYEIVRVLRGLFHLKTAGKWILDTIYFSIAAILVFQMIFLCNYGTLRGFFGVAFILGAAACHIVLGNRVSQGILRILWKIRRKIIQPCVRKCKRLLKKTKKCEKNP